MKRHAPQTPPHKWMSVLDYAKQNGITISAVYQLIKGGTIDVKKEIKTVERYMVRALHKQGLDGL